MLPDLLATSAWTSGGPEQRVELFVAAIKAKD